MKSEDHFLSVYQGPSSEKLSGWRQQRVEDQWFWDESSGGWWDLFFLWTQTDSHQMDRSWSSQLRWHTHLTRLYHIKLLSMLWLVTYVCHCCLACVSLTVIGGCRTLQLRERRVELWDPALGDIQSGGVSLPWDDQSAGSRAGGER